MSAAPLGPARESPNVDFICGWFAGCVETCVLYPINKLTFRQQLHGVILKDAFSQLFKEGVPYLYRGLLPPLIQRTSTRMIMFGMFDAYQRLLECPPIADGPTMCHARAAFLAGATEGILCPFERTQVLLQNPAYHKYFRNTGEAFSFVKSFGVREFYRGITLIVIRNGLSNAMFFSLKGPLKTLMTQATSAPPTTDDSLAPDVTEQKNVQKDQIQELADVSSAAKPKNKIVNVLVDFVTGAVLGATISTIFFPLNVVKNRMQSEIGTKFESPAKVFRIIWTERNKSLKGLYRGVHLNYTRSLMTWGITNAVFEFLKGFLRSEIRLDL
ncbi:mitochondrial carrier protein [Ditylenchus destructor]|nr:mitochondrial carrier protein [Ditylenchus destructor]